MISLVKKIAVAFLLIPTMAIANSNTNSLIYVKDDDEGNKIYQEKTEDGIIIFIDGSKKYGEISSIFLSSKDILLNNEVYYKIQPARSLQEMNTYAHYTEIYQVDCNSSLSISKKGNRINFNQMNGLHKTSAEIACNSSIEIKKILNRTPEEQAMYSHFTISSPNDGVETKFQYTKDNIDIYFVEDEHGDIKNVILDGAKTIGRVVAISYDYIANNGTFYQKHVGYASKRTRKFNGLDGDIKNTKLYHVDCKYGEIYGGILRTDVIDSPNAIQSMALTFACAAPID